MTLDYHLAQNPGGFDARSREERHGQGNYEVLWIHACASTIVRSKGNRSSKEAFCGIFRFLTARGMSSGATAFNAWL
jgi:hypothetical protein